MTIVAEDVRDLIGVSTSDIADAIITRIISQVSKTVENYLGVSETVIEEIDVLTGDPYIEPLNARRYHTSGWRTVKVSKTPLLAVREVKNDDTTLTVSNLTFNKDTGRIRLTTDSNSFRFFSSKANKVRIRYLHGAKSPSINNSERNKLNGAVSKGTSVDVTMDSGVTFAVNDYLWFAGMDGFFEASKVIVSNGGTTVQVDELSYSHEDNTIIALLVNDPNFDNLVRVISGIESLLYVNGTKQGSGLKVKLADFETEKSFKYSEMISGLITERNLLFDNVRGFDVV